MKLGEALRPYRFLVKTATSEHGSGEGMFADGLRAHYVVALAGIACFALCAGCALWHSFLATRCMSYQLVIVRYFGRLEGNRWEETHKEKFKEIIGRKQREQKSLLELSRLLLWSATASLVAGALMVVLCTALTVFGGKRSSTISLCRPIGGATQIASLAWPSGSLLYADR
jgi:hypothetical protein